MIIYKQRKQPRGHFPFSHWPATWSRKRLCRWTFFTLWAAFSWQVEIAWAEIHQSYSHMALSAAVSFHSRGQMVLCEARSDDWPDSHDSSLLFDQLVSLQTTLSFNSIVSEGGHMLLSGRTDSDFMLWSWMFVFFLLPSYLVNFEGHNMDLNMFVFNITSCKSAG